MRGAVACSVLVRGLTGILTDIDVRVAPGLDSVVVFGPERDRLAAGVDRVRAAVPACGWAWPSGRVRIIVTPSTAPSIEGAHDLAMAVAVLAAAHPTAISSSRLAGLVLLGGLAPDGRLRPLRGILPAVLAARDHGRSLAIVPRANLTEAALAPGIDVVGAEDLRAVAAWLGGADNAVTRPAFVTAAAEYTGSAEVDLSAVRGRYRARWALEVAAAGGHHLRLIGPLTAGFGALARRLPGLLPRPTEAESLQIRAIASLAGTLPAGPLSSIAARPYVEVHHSASARALSGSATAARPGALARAHLGVLHLESYPDLHDRTLEALGASLEDEEVVVADRDHLLRMPCATIAVLTSHECLCYASSATACACPPAAKARHRDRLARVLAERVAITIRDNPDERTGFGDQPPESSAQVRGRVTAARQSAARRWREDGHTLNAHVPAALLRARFPLSRTEAAPLEAALRSGAITRRGADQTLAVAATIADLRGADRPSTHDIVEALHLRGATRP
ncbi:ATP-binding protein [Nocardia takedensis]|uniref:ATP-binding protein n=1 Tax=Nocardia takedensis TaxID=259390 RepID=UPI0005943755|nr:ATP-binding protein [Nocardia takedensis]